MEHKLVDNTLYVSKDKNGRSDGIVAQCTCGWKSKHFSSMSASCAFQNHQEEMDKKNGE